MMIRGGRFLVIGGAGFIGSHIVDQLLAAGASYVRVYDNFSRGKLENLSNALTDPRCELFVEGSDILHRDMLNDAMRGVDGVFHLAAMWLLQCNDYPRAAFDVNVMGTMNVIESAIRNNIKKLVFSSSASVYGEAQQVPISESHPFACQEFYGASKVCGEMLLSALALKSQQSTEGMEFVGLRYMNVYGPRQESKGEYIGVVTRMVNALRSQQDIVIYDDGEQAYDFIHVHDCANANLLAMESSASNVFLNIGTGKKTSIKSLAEKLVSFYGSIGLSTVKNVKKNRPFVRNRIGCTKLAEEVIGFKASVDLDRGLRSYLEWTEIVSKDC